MAYRGDLLQTEALLLDSSGDPIAGASITIIASTGPGGEDLDPTRFDWSEEEDGVYLVTYQTNDTDLYGRYYVAFEFDDPDDQQFETEDGEWFLEADRPVPQITAPWSARTGSNTNVAPSYIDDDGTFDSRYAQPGDFASVDHVHGDLGVLNFNDSASINFTVADPDITAVAIFGTTAGTVAEGSALAAKAALAHTHAQADVTNLVADLAAKAATTHAHSGADITSGTVPIARIPTGTSGTTVALGNHGHTIDAGSSIFIDGGGSTPTATAIWGFFQMTFTGTITKIWMGGLPAGAIQFDIWKETEANWPPNVSDSICGVNKPKIAATNNDGVLTDFTGWTTTTFTVGDVVIIYIDSVTTITQCGLTIHFDRVI
jgi:hypothetical protein